MTKFTDQFIKNAIVSGAIVPLAPLHQSGNLWKKTAIALVFLALIVAGFAYGTYVP